MHLTGRSLPSSIENGARRIMRWDVEIVETDGGNEVRNSRWASPLRSWELAFNNAQLGSPDHIAVEQLWLDSEGGNHTFDWYDERDAVTVVVRFDADLTFTNTVGPYYHLDTFVIKEVRE